MLYNYINSETASKILKLNQNLIAVLFTTKDTVHKMRLEDIKITKIFLKELLDKYDYLKYYKILLSLNNKKMSYPGYRNGLKI